jgi:CheY-like chemotaxis protein
MEGYEVVTAGSGAEALERLAWQRFDCVLTDLGMPEVSGWEVARAAGGTEPRTPVVLVSGWGAQIEAGAAEGAGVARVLQKPYTFDAIRRVVAEVLAAARA